MTTQPTDHRKTATKTALAFAALLLDADVPAPDSITVYAPYHPGGEATVEALAHHNLPTLFAWQQAFGGEITHRLLGERQVYSVLAGRAYDAPFRLLTLRKLTPTGQAAEAQLCARWCAEHGPYDDWAEETRTAWQAQVLNFRTEAAA